MALSAFRIRVFLTAALFVGTAGAQNENSSLPIQVPPETEKTDAGGLVIRQSVRRVIVDVVVSDSNGKAVPGLTPDDFTIAEDGKHQRIRSFDYHDFDSVADTLPKLPTSLPANTFVNLPGGPERGPLYVLLLDLLNTEVEDQPTARQQLLKFVRSKPLGTRFAIFVVTDNLHLIQGFTEDRNLLADAVDPKNPHSRMPKIFLYADNFRPYISIPRVLMGIAKFLAQLPGHKNIIWLSEAFPSAILPTSTGGSEGVSFSDEVKEATDTLAQGQIAVYPVDLRGVAVTSPTGSTFAGGSSNPSALSGSGSSLSDSKEMAGPASGSGSGNAADAALNARYMTEQEIADATGGRAFYSTNDLEGALVEATEAGGHYYTLTYSPSNQNYNGRLRHIHVELSRRGYHLAYRRSYYGNPGQAATGTAQEIHAPSELQPMPVSRPADSLSPNMQHGAPLAHQLLFRARIHALGPPTKATREQMDKLSDQPAYFRARRKDKPAKPLRPVQLQTYEIDYAVAARYPALEVAAAAFDGDGKMLNGAVQRAAEEDDPFADGKTHEAIYRLQQQFDVPMAAVSLRIAVRDVATDHVGALEITLPLAPENESADASAHSPGPSGEIGAAKPR
jgi:VWFA-related protein